MITRHLLTALACGALVMGAAALPAPRGFVNDFAEVIDAATEAKIAALADDLNARTGVELAVVTIPSYAPEASIEDYAVALFKAWGIGKAKADNGLLLIAAVAERRVRIEVGYGLEPIVTDGRAGAIIDGDIIPAFRRGAYGEGLYRGAAALAALVASEGGSVGKPQEDQGIPVDLVLAALLLGGILALVLLTNRAHWYRRRRPWDDVRLGPGDFGGRGGFGGFGGGFGGFGGGASGGGGASRGW